MNGGLGRIEVDLSTLHGESVRGRSLPYLRSAGLARKRWLGHYMPAGGDGHYYSLHRIIKLLSPDGYATKAVRYCKIDSVTGRVELNVVVPSQPFLSLDFIDDVFDSCRIEQTKPVRELTSLVEISERIGGIIQSRTTKEIFHRYGHRTAVFSSSPILILEGKSGRTGELTRQMTAVPIKMDGLQLFFGQSRQSYSVWLIVRANSDRSLKITARALRMYLSNSHCLQAAFRVMARRVPRLADAIDIEVDVDRFTQYATRNGRSLATLKITAAGHSGVDLASMASRAVDMMLPAEIQKIEAYVESTVSRRNIVKILEKRLAEEKKAQEENERNKSINQYIIAIFGSITGVRQKIIRMEEDKTYDDISDSLLNLSNNLSVFCSGLDSCVRSELDELISEISYALQVYKKPRSKILRKINRIRKLTSSVHIGRKQLSASILNFEMNFI
ncbi:hypothetical protein [Pseudochelatococcus contaminans]|nr:hypothetical protein [Pseudochelatococcus contaminans]